MNILKILIAILAFIALEEGVRYASKGHTNFEL
jgi:hypothetical protein